MTVSWHVPRLADHGPGRHFVLLLLALPLLGSPVLPAAPAHAQTTPERIDALVAKYADFGMFNGSVLAAQNGEVIYEKGFGDAQMEWNVPNSPDTRFRIGSVTKQFTASLILQLVEDGKIDLQGTINDYLPDYPEAQGSRVTIHQLLTHTSGIPSYTGLPNFAGEIARDPYEPEEFLDVFSGLELEFEPGSEWRYSNSGYFLLGVIIEKVTGKPYDRVLQERILEPLGLDNTGYDHYADVIERRATGYTRTVGEYRHAEYLDTSLPYAAGMMYSTVEDLYKWDQLLYGKGPFREAKTKELMFAPHAVVGEDSTVHYGYGWAIRTASVGERNVRVIEHGGGIYGFVTAFWRMPDERNTVIVMDNSASPRVDDMVEGIVDILYGESAEEPKQPISEVVRATIEAEGLEAAIARYHELKEADPEAYEFGEPELNRLGYYYLGRGDTETAIRIFRLNVEIYPDAFNTYDSLGEAYLAAGDREHAIANYQRSLELNPGNTNATEVLGDLGVEVSEPDVEIPDEVLVQYIGRYELRPGFILAVTKEGSQMYVQATGQSRFEIFPDSEDGFYLKAVPAQITFERDEDGEVDSLTLHQNGQNARAEKLE